MAARKPRRMRRTRRNSRGSRRKYSSRAGSGATGLPNAGTASDGDKTLKHWREIAVLTDDDSDKKQN